jgi:hypothetical protein
VSATWKVKTAEKWRHRGRHRGLHCIGETGGWSWLFGVGARAERKKKWAFALSKWMHTPEHYTIPSTYYFKYGYICQLNDGNVI